jgi:hypothetical protein
MKMDALNNVYITGRSMGLFNLDFATVKYDSAGNLVWVARYEGPANDYDSGEDLDIDKFGNVYVTGISNGGGKLTWYDYCTIKYDANGDSIWVRRFSGNYIAVADWPWAVRVDETLNVYVTGYANIFFNTGVDICTIKYDSAGTQQWVGAFDGVAHRTDGACCLELDNNGNVYVAGQSYHDNSETNSDYAAIKYNSSGVQQWVYLYNGPANDFDAVTDLLIGSDGSIYTTGESSPSGNYYTNRDFYTVKYNPAGVVQWSQRYNGPGDSVDVPYEIIEDNSGNLYVVGRSGGVGTGDDATVVKYSQSIGITPITGKIPGKFQLYQNYPNPFNPSTRIQFEIPANTEHRTSNIELIVYDILGRQIAVLVDELLKPGSYEVIFDGINYPSGTYICRLTSADHSETRKMVLMK